MVTVPGEAFGTQEHIRLSYAVAHSDIEEGLVENEEIFRQSFLFADELYSGTFAPSSWPAAAEPVSGPEAAAGGPSNSWSSTVRAP